MKVSLASLVALLALLFVHSCNDEPPTAPAPDPERALTLTVADSSLHEIWLRVALPDSLSGRTVKIYRNDTLRFAFDLVRRDTVVLDSGLALGTPYAYRALRLENTRALDSTQLSTATMPTTSHAVVWRVDTLGTTATWLNDVCVINDTCIWVVGQIHAPPQDSLGYWTTYNAARFDGQQWHYQRVEWTYQGQTGISELNSIFSFSQNDIWVGSSAPYHWDGVQWTGFNVTGLFNGYIQKFWGTSSRDLYAVGTNGSIMHYNGTVWRRVESGTTTIVRDVWGSIDKATGDTLVLAAVSGNDRLLLRLRDAAPATRYSWSGGSVNTVWFRNHLRLFAAGGGIWLRELSGTWNFQSGLPWDFKERLRGRGENDVFAAGHFGFLAHFNGETWQVYPDLAVADIWESMDYRGSTVCVVGYLSGRGVVAIGWRNLLL